MSKIDRSPKPCEHCGEMVGYLQYHYCPVLLDSEESQKEEALDYRELKRFMLTRANEDTLTINFGALRAYIDREYISKKRVRELLEDEDERTWGHYSHDATESRNQLRAELKKELNLEGGS